MNPARPIDRPRPARLPAVTAACLALLAVAIAFADRAGPRVSDISTSDLLFWGAQPGRIPPAAWPAIDAAVDRRRDVARQLVAQHEAKPGDWSIATVADFDELGRDLVRRGDEAIEAERGFARSLHDALTNAGVDEARARRLASQWLFRSLNHGMGAQCPWSDFVLLRVARLDRLELDPAERAAAESALGGRLERLVTAAIARARLGHRGTRRFAPTRDAAAAEAIAPLIAADEAEFCEAVAALVREQRACHRAIVDAVGVDRRAAVTKALRADLFFVAQPGSTDGAMLPVRVVGPRMPGVDDDQRRRLAALAERVDASVQEEIARGVGFVEAALDRGEHEAAAEQMRALQQRVWRTAYGVNFEATSIIGPERVEQLGSLADPTKDLRTRLLELVGPDAADAVVADAGGMLGLEYAGDMPWRFVSHPVRWRSPLEGAPVSPALRVRLEKIAGHRADLQRCLAEALALHEQAWTARVTPEQTRLRAALERWQSRNVVQFPGEDDVPWQQALAEIDSLRHVIESAERDLGHAVRSCAPDDPTRDALVAWLLDRVVELCAPNVPVGQNELGIDGVLLVLPVVPSELAGLAGIEGAPATGVAPLLPALAEAVRVRWSSMTRLVILEAEARRRIGPGWERTGKAPSGVEEASEWLRDAAIAHQADPAAAERVWLDAWRPVEAAWREAIEPETWERVRVAIAETMFPRLPTHYRSAPETIDRLARACARADADDPRTAILEEMAASVRARRAARLVEAAEETLTIAPRPGEGVVVRGGAALLPERTRIHRRFCDDVSEMEWRALRDAMILAGDELALQAPLTRAILKGDLDRW